jgi:hypothetical protein
LCSRILPCGVSHLVHGHLCLLHGSFGGCVYAQDDGILWVWECVGLEQHSHATKHGWVSRLWKKHTSEHQMCMQAASRGSPLAALRLFGGLLTPVPDKVFKA